MPQDYVPVNLHNNYKIGGKTCDCCPRVLPKAKAHKNLIGPDNFIVVNHFEDMTPEKIFQKAEEFGAIQDGRYFVLFGGCVADPELYTKEQIREKMCTN